MPLVAVVAAIVGAVVIAEYVRRRRGGRDPLGPRSTGELPDTGWAFVAGALGWYLLVGLANSLLAGSDARRYGGTAFDVVLSTGVNLIVALALLRSATSGTRHASLPSRRLVEIGVCAGFAMFAAQYAVGRVITTACDLLGRPIPEQAIVDEARNAAGGDALVYLVGAVVLAPLAEEIFFRGILLPAASRFVGERTALALQAVVFGLIHVDGAWHTWPLAIPLALVGWCAGFVYLRTGSLAVPILLHATFNALNLASLRAG